MIVVFVAAETIRGSKRWIDLGFIQFQPSELGKVLFVLAIAGFLVERVGRVTRWRTIFSAIGLGAVPILLVFLQPDLGTALVYAAALFAVLFFVGVRWRQLLALLAIGVHRDRLGALAPPGGRDPGAEAVPGGASHARSRAPIRAGSRTTSNQSITAVGSGGLTGRGVVEASQTRLDYLPEHATDFAFASLAEQRGFVGCGDPAPALPARRLARAARRHGAPETSTAPSSRAGSCSRSSSRSS